MKTISLCMIVKNEEQTLARCIESIKDVVDEIIVVDTGSTDATKEIAKRFTDKIYDFPWCNDFSKARNAAFEKATKEFILWMDADDIFLPEEKEKLILLKKELTDQVDGIMLKYCMGVVKDGEQPMTYYRQRMIRRGLNQRWHEPVHEYLDIVGNVITKDITVTHAKAGSSGDRNVKIYESILEQGKELSARGLYYYAKELYERQKTKKAVEYFEKYLEREEGWSEDKINACFLSSQCYTTLGENKKVQKVLLKSFEYGIPRAEICCKLGEYYIRQGDLKTAVYWYETALNLEQPKDCWGFTIQEYWDFIPCMQLCYCYDRLGQKKEAYEYNERAAVYRPNNPKVLYNRDYFSNIL